MLVAALVAAAFLSLGCQPASQSASDATRSTAPPGAQTEAQAKAGDVAAQLALGRWHLGEAGQPRDYDQAAQWLALAAEAGKAEAQFLLGTLYEAGGGVEQSTTNALKWFQLAAAQHHAGALYNLGSMHAAGRGVPQDSAKAASYYQQAAELGDPLAQFNMAQRCELGRGVGTNLIESWKWYELAQSGGVADALRARQRLESRLTPAQLLEARLALKQFSRHSATPVK